MKLAPIFMRPKSKPKQKAASLEDKVVHQEASSSDCTEGDTLQPDNPVLINIDAANKAFSALFTGARSSKTVPSGSTAVPQTPAPWPVYSHVMQKEEFGTGSASSLNVSKSELFDLVETIECEGKQVDCNRLFAARVLIVQNPTCWRAKVCAKTPLGNINKGKSHFSSYLCFIFESGTFFLHSSMTYYFCTM